MENIIILILSIITLMLIVSTYTFYDKWQLLITEKSKLSNKINDMIRFKVGDKVLLPNVILTHTKSKVEFNVDFTMEILEVSTDKLKVKVISWYTSNNLHKSNTNIPLQYDNSWVSKKEVSLIRDDISNREDKFEELLD